MLFPKMRDGNMFLVTEKVQAKFEPNQACKYFIGKQKDQIRININFFKLN